MTLVTSGAWIPEAQERKAVRDEVRERFRGRVGVKPLKDQGDLSLSPEAQLSVVLGLIDKANPQGSSDIENGLSALSAALTRQGLATGAPMAAIGKTLLDFVALVPQELSKAHFGGSNDD